MNKRERDTPTWKPAREDEGSAVVPKHTVTGHHIRIPEYEIIFLKIVMFLVYNFEDGRKS